jgi:hypothetical protein
VDKFLLITVDNYPYFSTKYPIFNELSTIVHKVINIEINTAVYKTTPPLRNFFAAAVYFYRNINFYGLYFY